MILARARRLLGRLRPAVNAAVRPHPPRRWSDELVGGGTDAQTWVRRRLAASRLHVGISDDRVDHLARTYPALAAQTVAAADRIVQHEFDLLGSGPFVPRDPDRHRRDDGYEPIDWSLDPVAGLRFPAGIPIDAWNLERMRPGSADIKLPWELGRCQHWPVLAQAYRLTGDDRYAVEVAQELDDFVEANPIGTAVNWACTMDVALRAANWAIAFEILRGCRALDDRFWTRAHEALFDHGVFIEGHLENTYEVTSNHFLSNVVGLFFLAAVFRDLPRGAAWDRQCRAWLAQEMAVQVLPDGADYESSVPYHRLVTELFLGAACLAAFSGDPLPPAVALRIEPMVAFLAAVLRPDGLMPQVGDADDGRLHILTGYGSTTPQDARHLFGPAGTFFGRAEWTALGGDAGAWEAAWWGLEERRPQPRAEAHRPVEHFPHAGITVLRDAGRYLIVTNGIVGTAGFGNHKHNDLLGFEFHVGGTPILVDPGSYVYTSDPDARNRFRSVRSHNTLIVDGREPNDIKPEWLFRMFEAAHPEHVGVVECDGCLEYRGRHRGYARPPNPVVHERVFRLSRREPVLELTDMLEGSGTHELRWRFHFAPGVNVAIDGLHARISSPAGPLTLGLPEGVAGAIERGWYSPSYGVRLPCVALEFTATISIEGRREYVYRITS